MRSATLAVVCAALALVGFTREAAAQTMSVALDYRGPTTCPTREAFWDALATRTQRVQQATGSSADVLLRVDLATSGAGVLGRLEIVRDGLATEPRYVEADDCNGVIHALALTAALGIDPGALTRRPEPTPPPTTMEPLPEFTLQPARWTRPSDWRSALATQIVGAQVVDSDASWGIAASIAAHNQSGGAWAPVLRGGVALLQSAPFGSDSPARFTLLTALARACVLHADSSPIRIRPCIGGQLGTLRARGHNVSNPESSSRVWVSAALAVEVGYVISESVALQLDLAAHLPFAPQSYTQGLSPAEREQVAQTPSLVPWVAAGLSYDL